MRAVDSSTGAGTCKRAKERMSKINKDAPPQDPVFGGKNCLGADVRGAQQLPDRSCSKERIGVEWSGADGIMAFDVY